MSALTTCGYSGSQFALVGREFGPGQNATVDVMPTADPRTGEPTSTRAVTADDSGRFSVLLDVPASEGTRPVARAVRVRPNPDGSPGMPLVLAAALVKTVSRGVSIRPQAPTGRVGTIERWTVTGLPEGTPLYAHYRRDRKPVKTVALGEAEDPCGRLRFDLRTVPGGHERSGSGRSG